MKTEATRTQLNAARWLTRAPARTEQEKAAYLDGIFDVGISNEDQAAIEQMFKTTAQPKEPKQ